MMSDDFCLLHGYDYMMREFGKPVAHCWKCEPPMTTPPSADLLPCPFCSTPIRRVISKARSFNPPRDYIEWHHDTPAVNCFIYNSKGSLMAATGDNTQAEADFIAAWNRRPQPIAGDGWNEAEVMRLAEAWVEAALTFNGVRHFVGGYTEAEQLRNARQSFSRALRRPAQPAGAELPSLVWLLTWLHDIGRHVEDHPVSWTITCSPPQARDAAARITAALARPAQGDEAMAEKLRAWDDMITNCAGVPQNPDSLPMMLRHEIRAALATITGREG
jgi:hypothetical protein